jgi:hypothetical protein
MRIFLTFRDLDPVLKKPFNTHVQITIKSVISWKKRDLMRIKGAYWHGNIEGGLLWMYPSGRMKRGSCPLSRIKSAIIRGSNGKLMIPVESRAGAIRR